MKSLIVYIYKLFMKAFLKIIKYIFWKVKTISNENVKN
jgi:hypothetical protein